MLPIKVYTWQISHIRYIKDGSPYQAIFLRVDYRNDTYKNVLIFLVAKAYNS